MKILCTVDQDVFHCQIVLTRDTDWRVIPIPQPARTCVSYTDACNEAFQYLPNNIITLIYKKSISKYHQIQDKNHRSKNIPAYEFNNKPGGPSRSD